MNSYFIDTNILLRFLLKDNQKQYRIAKKLFEKAEQGKLNLWTTDIVILETVWTLKSFYKFDRKIINETVNALISLPGFDIPNKKFLIQALYDFDTKNIDFADTYNYQLAMKENKRIISFDKDFQKLGSRPLDLDQLLKRSSLRPTE